MDPKTLLKNTRVELFPSFTALQETGVKAGVHTLIDLKTMKTFQIFLGGISSGYHTDWTPNAPADTTVLQSLNPGWSWNARPGVLVLPNGRLVACGFHTYPHACIIGGSPGAPLKNQSNTRPPGGWEIGGHCCMYFSYKTGGGMNDSINPKAREAYEICQKLVDPNAPAVTVIPVVIILKRGSTGDAVRILQAKLNNIGFSLIVDGSYGPATEKAIKELQSKQGLKVDGEYGKITAAALETMLNTGETMTAPAPAPIPEVTIPVVSAKKYPINPITIDQLVDLGIITSPEVWKKVDNLQWLDELLDNFTRPGVIGKGVDNNIKTIDTALWALNKSGLINNPDYWRKAVEDKIVPWLDFLIIKVANTANLFTCTKCSTSNI